MTPLAVVILALAAYRVTRLVTRDAITEPIRDRTTKRLRPDSRLRELLECAWCTGFWISVVAAACYAAVPVVIVWLALPFALSAVVGLLANHE